MEDIIGKKIGNWTIIKSNGKGRIEVQCICGTIKSYTQSYMNMGNSKQCTDCSKQKNGFATKYNDIQIGSKINSWTILGYIPQSHLYNVHCDCGAQRKLKLYVLSKNHGCRSCAKKHDKIAGKRFERWTVLKLVSVNKIGYWYLCKCECGNEKIVQGYKLSSGRSKGCKPCALRKIWKSRINSALIDKSAILTSLYEHEDI